MAQQQRSGILLLAFEGEQSQWSKRAASLTLNIRISSMSEILFKKQNFAHKLILKTYLAGSYLAFFQQFWLLHFQKQTHMLMPIFEIFLHSGPQCPPTPSKISLCFTSSSVQQTATEIHNDLSCNISSAPLLGEGEKGLYRRGISNDGFIK